MNGIFVSFNAMSSCNLLNFFFALLFIATDDKQFREFDLVMGLRPRILKQNNKFRDFQADKRKFTMPTQNLTFMKQLKTL